MRRKVFSMVATIISIVALWGCAATRYDIKPEMRGEILKAKEAKQVSLVFKYYEHKFIRPLIGTTENLSPDAEEIEAGKKFLEIVKEELKNRGFSINGNPSLSHQLIDIEMGFAYKKSIPLVTTGSIATRWKVAFKNTPLFEIADFKLLAVLTGIGGVFSEEKGKELAKLIVDQFIEELEEMKQ